MKISITDDLKIRRLNLETSKSKWIQLANWLINRFIILDPNLIWNGRSIWKNEVKSLNLLDVEWVFIIEEILIMERENTPIKFSLISPPPLILLPAHLPNPFSLFLFHLFFSFFIEYLFHRGIISNPFLMMGICFRSWPVECRRINEDKRRSRQRDLTQRLGRYHHDWHSQENNNHSNDEENDHFRIRKWKGKGKGKEKEKSPSKQ